MLQIPPEVPEDWKQRSVLKSWAIYLTRLWNGSLLMRDEEFSGLLVVATFTKSDCTWVVTMGLLHASSSRGRFASSLGSQLFPWGLATSGPSCFYTWENHWIQNKI
jgi:hypothetical protein